MKLLDAIEAKAKAATPGKWEDHNWDVMERPHVVAHALWNGKDHCNGHFDVPCTAENTAYIATMSPDVALKLVEAVRVMRKALADVSNQRGYCQLGPTSEMTDKIILHANGDYANVAHRSYELGSHNAWSDTAGMADEALSTVSRILGEDGK